MAAMANGDGTEVKTNGWVAGRSGGVAGSGVAFDEAPGFRETLQPRPLAAARSSRETLRPGGPSGNSPARQGRERTRHHA